ncbi:class I SAM-dependent methyltransferase, partial [Agrobacterium rhizogenes]|nr:class I SAM-dependent methyltransferase [Rhizobium rhizogenes]
MPRSKKRSTKPALSSPIRNFSASPTRDAALEKAVDKTGLKLTDKELFGQSYALTLAEWRQRFHARWQAISLLGFDDRFRRLWDYYLCYCEAGFAEGSINVGFYTIEHR